LSCVGAAEATCTELETYLVYLGMYKEGI